MNRRLHTAFAVTAALGAGLLMTACGGSDKPAASAGNSPSVTATSTSAAPASDAPTPAGTTAAASTSSGGGTAGSGSSDKGALDKGGSGGSGKKVQNCASKDITWSVTSESQAGGYFLVKAKAKAGVTCVMPGGLPVVAFGSDGTQAGPAEQVAGPPFTLRAGVTLYAGVNPKTTSQNGGKELDSIIVSASDADPDPVSLKVGSYVVDKPVVTDWHTSAADAVPFS